MQDTDLNQGFLQEASDEELEAVSPGIIVSG
jgi:hypothetical protein